MNMQGPPPASLGPTGASPTYGIQPSAFGANVRYALSALRRHVWMAAAIVAACTALAVVWTLLQTPQYTAYASVQIEDQSEQVLGEDFDNVIAEASDWDTDRFLNTQLEILQSKAVALRVAGALDLGQDASFYEAMGVELANPATDGSTDLAAAVLRGGMQVELPASSRIARIGYSSQNPNLSARVADAFADQFIKANLQRRFDSSAYARDIVEEQLEEARIALEETEGELNDYARAAGIIRTRDALAPDARQQAGGTVTASSLLALNDAAIEARAASIAAEARWRAVQGTALLASPPVLANPTVQTMMTRRAQLQTELESARDRYFAGHPTIARLEAEVAATNSELQNAARNVRNAVQSDYEAARRTQTALDRQVSRLRGDTLVEQDQSVRYNTLARQADTARQIYDGLLQRFRQLNASAGVAASNISIVDKAEIPGVASSPRPLRNVALGLLLGLALAGLAVFLRDQLDDVVHVPEDIEDKLELPLLGVVPQADDGGPVAAMDDPKSPVAESYNSLRGALMYSSTAGLPKILVVTSAQAGEGKTTSSIAIAKGFARMNMHALLIDADLRRPAIHELTGVANKRGLTDILTGHAQLEDVVETSPTHAFEVLPAGPLPPSPTELLSSPRMAQLLELASERYDTIVIDSPPVLGLADAPILAAIGDGTVFIVEADRGRSGQLKSALRRLRAMHPVLLGAVLTKFDPERSGNRYTSHYGYDYYRYGGTEKATA